MAMKYGPTDPKAPVIVPPASLSFQESRTPFDYAVAVRSIVERLERRFGCEFRLYQENNSNDIWNGLEDDIRAGYEGVEHEASLFDLVETREFSYEADPEPGAAGFDIRPTLRNNLFVYPRHRVAFTRIPLVRMHSIGWEELIFAADDRSLQAFLAEMNARQLADRQIIMFVDANDGMERRRESPVRPVDRDDVLLDDTLKQEIYRSVDEFFSGDRSFYETYGIPYKRGILLYGKPGNGKTTLVKSIAGSVKAPVAYWQITPYTSSGSIRQVFDSAAKMAPMVLVVEDIDSLPESCRSFFLNTLDGVASKEGIFLIGTTNYPEKIDPALMNRAGRFDRAYEVKSPNEAQRLAYLTRRGLGRFADADAVARTAKLTEGFTVAQLGELYVSAALQMHYEQEVALERLVEGLKSDFSRGRSRDWLSDAGARRLGFVAGE